MLFSDRLEITNPGRLPDSLTFESLRHPHSSVPHNPLIAEPLYLTQYIERLGTGTGDMIRLCVENGLPEPVYGYRDGFVTTIWRPNSENTAANDEMSGKMSGKMSGEMSGKMSGTAAKIVLLMRTTPEITIPEIAVALKRTERTVERLVRQLREDEVIGRVGPAKGGHWEVFE